VIFEAAGSYSVEVEKVSSIATAVFPFGVAAVNLAVGDDLNGRNDLPLAHGNAELTYCVHALLAPTAKHSAHVFLDSIGIPRNGALTDFYWLWKLRKGNSSIDFAAAKRNDFSYLPKAQ